MDDLKFHLTQGQLLGPSSQRSQYRVRLIRAGKVRAQGNRQSNIEIPAEVLRQAALIGKFEARACFLDHAGWGDYPSLRNLVGIVERAAWNEAEHSIEGVIRLYDGPAGQSLAGVLDDILRDAEQGSAVPDIGLSLVFWPRWEPGDGEGKRLAEILHVESCDFVFEPAADGRILQKLSVGSWQLTERAHAKPPLVDSWQLTEESHAKAQAVDSWQLTERAHAKAQAVDSWQLTERAHAKAQPDGSQVSRKDKQEDEEKNVTASRCSCGNRDCDNRDCFGRNDNRGVVAHRDNQPGRTTENTENTERESLGGLEDQLLFSMSKMGGRKMDEVKDSVEVERTAQDWIAALGSSAAQSMIAASSLPRASRERLTSQVQAHQEMYRTPEAVQAAIEAEKTYLAKLQEDQVVQIGGTAPRTPHISMGLTGLEQVEKALEALIAGIQPPAGVAPLSGIREAYVLLSGDYEMTGLFHSERISLANVTSATMPGLVANALNKRVTNLFQEYPRWWEKIVHVEDFNTLQQVKWITLGGIGELPTVAEGAAYTELTWADKTEPVDFVKKGGFLGITLEAMDKDDTRKLQAAPRAMAQAAWLSLSRTVSNIFTQTAGVGPVMSDAKALFHIDHGNLGTTALSYTAYSAARTAMRKQTELNSAQRLDALTAPKYLLVPPDLEITALTVLASEGVAGSANKDANIHTGGNTHEARMSWAKERVIVVDLWTDTNDWAAAADPLLYPALGLGFRYGRTPEIFSVASPTSGLMFTHDTMPVKARYFFAAGPMDWRGLYKANVAGG
jgi:hypothetical protein